MKKKISIIIPCYNELENIKLILKKINNYKADKFEFILVNNGSKDGTKKFLESLNQKYFNNIGVKFIEIKKNIGYGHGIKIGIKNATSQIIAWTHSDINSNISDIIKIFKKNQNYIIKNNILIKGYRKNRGIFDKIFSLMMSFISNLILRTKINDVNAQPKIFPRKLLKSIKSIPDDFSLDLFVLMTAYKKNYIIKEFPVNFIKRKFGKAKGGGTFFGKLKLSINTLISILKYRNDIRYS
jgi:glycosyltransferase involved in cell wall biosynthesis